jgi:hypothetical protein
MITDTDCVALDIPLHPIFVVPLAANGAMPDLDGPEDAAALRLYQPRHLPPRNRTERQLLSVWLNTHQALFMTVAMSSYAVLRAIDAIRIRDLPAVVEWLTLASEARFASAAYTHMDALTQPLYEAFVRESMKLVHPGFSGVSNLESVRMEQSLRELKDAAQACLAVDRGFAAGFERAHERLCEADHFWWRSHGQAMRRMVRCPVSLARMDAKGKASTSGGPYDFEAYRSKVLRDPKAMTDYDAYFSVERRADLTLRSWRRNLLRVLAASDDYVTQHGPVAERSRHARPFLFALMDQAAAAPRGAEEMRRAS